MFSGNGGSALAGGPGGQLCGGGPGGPDVRGCGDSVTVHAGPPPGLPDDPDPPAGTCRKPTQVRKCFLEMYGR